MANGLHVLFFVFLSLTEKTRTFSKPLGFFGLVRLEIFYSVASAAMSCQRWLVRQRVSLATRRSSAPLHNVLNILLPLRRSAAAPYNFTERQHPCPLPSSRFRLCGMRRSAISFALGTTLLSSLRVITRPHSVNTEEAIHL
jgi:hypothetical protein